ncbi:hypothetical protein [Sphingomonas sp. IC-56]|uniref:hypothetical protein n=1 Tax=Sphingomonas sp. IC-56 TaxID=2898529 RepID=UPI001E2F9EB2|nr:hypothetical protein [Sphingomonas sp. IC-56]
MRFLARLLAMTGDFQPHDAELRAPADEQALSILGAPQRAALRLRWGERSEANAEVEVTPAGLLSIGGLVGMILLGSAVIVRAAGQARARPAGKMNAD